MFPYPSGDGLHVGHTLGYVASDIFARYKKSKGYNVLNPMGYDSFGLPAEQYAIQTGQHPAITTQKNTQRYTEQLKNMWLDFDWDRCFCTSEPDYYKHTQKIFIWMFKSFFCLKDKKAHHIEELYHEFEKNGNDGTFAFGTGEKFSAQQWKDFSEKEKYKISLKFRLAYQDDILVNWCPKLGTVLANDEVKNGYSERGGFPVEQKKMQQWCLRITAYADRLLENLNIGIKNKISKIETSWKPNLQTKERKAVMAMIKHWKEKDKYLILSYPNEDCLALLTGGIKEGEKVKETVVREIREEVGYINIKRIINIDTVIENCFWHPRKNINSKTYFYPVIVELANGDKVEVSEKEKNIQVEQWATEEELKKILQEQGTCWHKKEAHICTFELFKQYENYLEWPESTKEVQRNWIGRSNGAKIFFEIKNEKEKLEIFTTRPETIFGVTFIAIAQNHVLAEGKKLEEDKSGIFTGKFAIHPFTKKLIPIWIADYVLSDYGTGAVMSVPAQDQRDEEFAKKYDLEIIKVIENEKIINSDFLSTLNILEAREKIISKLEEMGIGERKVNYKLRDAVFSRQRYWGEPMPVFYKDGLPYVFAEEDLPLKLPNIKDFTPTGKAPLANVENWKKDGYDIETGTMPGWAGSSWYFIRYLDHKNENDLADEKIFEKWNKVDLYLGGAEHATGHLIYARFFASFLFDIKKIPYEEPFKKLIHQGMILGESALAYRIENTNTFVSAGLKDNYNTCEVHVNVNLVDENFSLDVEAFKKWRPDLADAEFILENEKFQCGKLIEKMSKSKHNVVNPDDVIKKYGVDTLRLYLMFLGPVEQQKPWNTQGIEGVHRFLKKVEILKNKICEESSDHEQKFLHRTIKKVGEDIERYSFNTAISSMMICLNKLNEQEKISRDTYQKFLLILYPFAPKMTLELLHSLNFDAELKFPDYDEKFLVEENFDYPIAINGKVCGQMSFCLDEEEEKIKKEVLQSELVAKYLGEKKVEKIFVIKNKMINVVG
jgi:leucyl-tRNA synthetase